MLVGLKEAIVIKRASEVFSLVMKTHNCLRSTYVSSPRIDALPFSPGHNEPLPLLGMRTKNHAPTNPVFKSIKSLEADHGMVRCHLSTSFQEGPHQKLFFHLK